MTSSPVLVSLYPSSRKNCILYQTQTAIVSPVHHPFVHLTSRLEHLRCVCQVLLLLVTHTEVEVICYWPLLLSEFKWSKPRCQGGGPLPSSPCSSPAWYESRDLEVGDEREKYQSKDFLCLTLLSLLHTPGSRVLLANPSAPLGSQLLLFTQVALPQTWTFSSLFQGDLEPSWTLFIWSPTAWPPFPHASIS